MGTADDGSHPPAVGSTAAAAHLATIESGLPAGLDSEASGPTKLDPATSGLSAASSGVVRRRGSFMAGLHRVSAVVSELSLTHSAAMVFSADANFVEEDGKSGWFAVSTHLVTTMFGAGVLGLPYAFSLLGWVAASLTLALCTATSAYSAYLLGHLHTLKDGRRVRTLRALGEEVWGIWGRRVVITLQFIDMVGGALIFTVAGGTSLMDIVHGCYGANGQACDSFQYQLWPWSLCFAGAMMLLAQFPDFHALHGVSLIGACMPILYAGVSFVSILVKGPLPEVTYGVRLTDSGLHTVMNVFSGIGAFAYAFGGQVVQNEVTAMLRTPPPIMQSMRRALALTYILMAVAYFGVACAGYGMMGIAVTGNVLQSIPYAAPAIIANVGVLLHVGAAYQVFSMNVYLYLEEHLSSKAWMPRWVLRNPWTMRAVIRCTYIAAITFLATLIPFFNQLSGLKGGLIMIPLCFCFPIAAYTTYHAKRCSTVQKAINWLLVAVFTCMSLVASVGAVYKIVQNAQTFRVFA